MKYDRTKGYGARWWGRLCGPMVLPLVLVPFESVIEEEQAAQRKQVAKARRLQALTDTQAMLCTVLGNDEG